MILRIGNEMPDAQGVMCIPYKWLRDKSTHLYIASNLWDEVQVVISDEIPADVLKYIALKSSKKSVQLPAGKLSNHCINLLCEFFPDKAGLIRKQAMLGRDLNELLY